MRVFIASTSEDLKAHRLAAFNVVQDAQWVPIGMEHFPADPRPPIEVCREAVASCDLVILLQAWRYGSVPGTVKGGDNSTSFTAFELATAERLSRPVLAFRADDNWPGRLWDRDRSSVERFRAGLNTAKEFRWEDDASLPVFRALLSQELANYRLKCTRAQPTSARRRVKLLTLRGVVNATKEGRRLPPTRATVKLRISGSDVTGTYENSAGDSGVISGSLDGTDIRFRFDSEHMSGACDFIGTLNEAQSALQGTYACRDGENGELNVVRDR